ncbi:MAG: leucyl aminopeptidase family protein [Chitinophagales bacterium]|nr:leucyl aminopeptidase family protein [Chitinophagales bacterium]
MQILQSQKAGRNNHLLILADKNTDWYCIARPEEDIDLIKSQIKKDIKQVIIPSASYITIVAVIETREIPYNTNEGIRKAGHKILSIINNHKIGAITIVNLSEIALAPLYFAEGMALGNYQFLEYKKEADKERHSLKQITIVSGTNDAGEIENLQAVIDSVYLVRNLVNKPVNYLNATGLANAIASSGKEAGFRTEIFNKSKISALKMGGLLAVNQGSVDPPTFTIMEYKPKKAINKKPIVLVGKGVVYDTGGLSIKTTSNSMDLMKSDMAGAATMLGVIYCAAKTKMPLHLIGLIPSTDNRPGFNAFAPGDVITMHNGMTVEMLNSDAEGRMILGDALSFARQYKPELVIDAATLTGAAHRAVGDFAIAYLSNASDEIKTELENCGMDVYERLIEFPLWEEYGEMLKSDIADIKNIGGTLAGAITAGKFLEKFTDYPWIHLDIAGVAYFQNSMGYKGKNGSGFGLRLIYRFLQKRVANG